MLRGSKRNRQFDSWAGVPALNLLATFRRRNSLPAVINKVGLMCSPAMGDTLLFSGAVQDIRAHFPAQELVHFCMPANLAAAKLVPGIDRQVTIDLTQALTTIKAFRAEKLDLMLDFTSWQKLTALYTMMSGARYTVGFKTAGQHRSRGYDLSVEHRRDLHEIDNHRSLLHALKIPTGHTPNITVPEAALPAVLEADEIIVFHLWPSGVRSWLREWPQERWLELARRLARPETLFVITGAPSDAERSAAFIEQMHAIGLHAQFFIGHDGLNSLSRLLQRADLVVSVNTGVMHLAAIAGAPTVSINGPNSNRRWGPVGPHAFGVESPGEGCGYLHLGFDSDGKPTDCMQRISVDSVFAATENVRKSQALAESA
jgi:ADP-heptose:LPS heptosyltransferase